MKHLRSGNLLIRTVDDKLVFEIDDGTIASAEVPLEDLSLINEFIRAHRETHSNRRRGFRLDIGQLRHIERQQLQVSVHTEAGPLPVTPADLSITGIRVKSEDLQGEAGMQTEVSLSFEDKAVHLPAVLVRRYDADSRFAFHFPEVFGEDGRLNPPREFTQILYALESLWLDRNLDLKWNLA
jgi:hypothetical protein